MLAKAALTLNAAIGVGLALFYFHMLPFAEGITCDARRSAGLLCAAPSSALLRGATGVLILIFVLMVSGLGYRARLQRPPLSAAQLCAVPVLILGWVGAMVMAAQ